MMETVCRLCLAERSYFDPSHYGYDSSKENSSPGEKKLEQLVLQYLPVKIVKTEDDVDYPFICTGCSSLIYQWHRFCTSCIENDQIYQERLQHRVGDAFNQQEHLVLLKDEVTENSAVETRKPRMYLEVELINVSEKIELSENDVDPRTDTTDFEEQAPKKKVKILKKSPVSRASKHSPNEGDKSKPSVDTDQPQKKLGRPRIYPLDYKAPPRREMCPVCGKFVSTLSEHIRIHGCGDKYQCPYCEKDFNTKSNWYRHLNIHTRAKEYKCEECGKEFSQRNGLKAHLSTHTKDRKYVCPVCEKTFYQRTAFCRHKRTHFEEPSVPCPECGRKFLCPGSMRNHLRMHLPREFACELCGRAFYRNSNLKTHMKTHQRKDGVRAQASAPKKES
ncbi:zinc finger protein 358-like [Armigeres subalbatus]|uniref:zinc finger protein 358-like n=1 Tax=Armigeres subalbatus TaxID=124917 RepID=UPI002ED6B46B